MNFREYKDLFHVIGCINPNRKMGLIDNTIGQSNAKSLKCSNWCFLCLKDNTDVLKISTVIWKAHHHHMVWYKSLTKVPHPTQFWHVCQHNRNGGYNEYTALLFIAWLVIDVLVEGARYLWLFKDSGKALVLVEALYGVTLYGMPKQRQ